MEEDKRSTDSNEAAVLLNDIVRSVSCEEELIDNVIWPVKESAVEEAATFGGTEKQLLEQMMEAEAGDGEEDLDASGSNLDEATILGIHESSTERKTEPAEGGNPPPAESPGDNNSETSSSAEGENGQEAETEPRKEEEVTGQRDGSGRHLSSSSKHTQESGTSELMASVPKGGSSRPVEKKECERKRSASSAKLGEDVNDSKRWRDSLTASTKSKATIRDVRKIVDEASSRCRSVCCDCQEEVARLKKQVEYWRNTAKGLQDIATNLAKNLNPNHDRKQRTVATNTPIVRLPITAIPGMSRQPPSVPALPPAPPPSSRPPGPVSGLRPPLEPPRATLRHSLLPPRPPTPGTRYQMPGFPNGAGVRPNGFSSVQENGIPGAGIQAGGGVTRPGAPGIIQSSSRIRGSRRPPDAVVDLCSDDEDSPSPTNPAQGRPLPQLSRNPLPTGSKGLSNGMPHGFDGPPPLPASEVSNGVTGIPKLQVDVKEVEHVKNQTKVTLSWDVKEAVTVRSLGLIASYELFVYQAGAGTGTGTGQGWSSVRTMPALDLPMACVVTMVRNTAQNRKFFFTVRAVLQGGNIKGECSQPTLVRI